MKKKAILRDQDPLPDPVVGHILGLQEYLNPAFHTVQMGNGALFVTGRLKRGIRKAGGGDEEGKGKLVVFCNHLILTNLIRAKKKDCAKFNTIFDNKTIRVLKMS